jgi:hypothetical protein
MRIPRRAVSIGSQSRTALALGGVLFAQNAPDKSADNTVGGSAEPVYGVGRGVSPPRPIYTPGPEISPEAKEARYQATVIVVAIVSGGGDVTDAKACEYCGNGPCGEGSRSSVPNGSSSQQLRTESQLL